MGICFSRSSAGFVEDQGVVLVAPPEGAPAEAPGDGAGKAGDGGGAASLMVYAFAPSAAGDGSHAAGPSSRNPAPCVAGGTASSGSSGACRAEHRAMCLRWANTITPNTSMVLGSAASSSSCNGSADGRRIRTPLTGGSASRASGATSSSSGSRAARQLIALQPVEGLRLGGFIGRGSYGRVYRGSYFGTKVAVKVIDDADVLARDQGTGESLEATLSTAVAHPHIVHTLKCAVVTGTRRLPARPPIRSWSVSVNMHGSAAGDEAGISGAAPAAGACSDISAGPGAVSGGSGSGRGCSSSGMRASASPSSASAASVSSSQRGAASGSTSSGGRASSGSAGSKAPHRQTWIIMEYADHGSLQNAMDHNLLRAGRVAASPPDVLAVLATANDIAAGMHHLHSLGILHGDLSASNVMLSSCSPGADLGGRDFHARVADFGLARRLEPSESVVHTNHYGTITHMPPELLLHGTLSKAADVFAFGVLLWQMWTGLRPWEGLNHAGVARAVLAEGRTLEFPPGTPAAIAVLGSACMAPDAAARPSFRDVLEVLEPLAVAELDDGERDLGF